MARFEIIAKNTAGDTLLIADGDYSASLVREIPDVIAGIKSGINPKGKRNRAVAYVVTDTVSGRVREYTRDKVGVMLISDVKPSAADVPANTAKASKSKGRKSAPKSGMNNRRMITRMTDTYRADNGNTIVVTRTKSGIEVTVNTVARKVGGDRKLNIPTYTIPAKSVTRKVTRHELVYGYMTKADRDGYRFVSRETVPA